MTEVMIVLVVTTALFSSAALLVSGRQSRVGFSQAVTELRGNMEQAINQVGSGYYADTAEYGGKVCSAPAGGEIGFSVGSAAKGSSGSCMFIGQAVQFGINNPSGQQRYAVHTIAGLRAGAGGQPVRDLTEARPKLVFDTGLTDTNGYPDGRTMKNLTNGLTFSWGRVGTTDIGGFALVSNVGEYDSTGMLASGTQALSLYPLLPNGLGSTVVGSAPPYTTDERNFARLVNPRLRQLQSNQANPDGGLKFCFASGGTDQSALITIGGTNRALSVSQEIINGNTRCNR